MSDERAKQRQRDEADIREGRATAAEVTERNGMFGALRDATVRIVSRRSRVKL